MAKILVVDDSEPMRCLLRAILEDQGHAVEEGCNGRECLELLAQERFDALVLDMMMPELDGIQAVRSIRENNQDLRIIAMSGGEAGFPAGAALKMSEMYGVDAALLKPFPNEELLSTLDRLLACRA